MVPAIAIFHVTLGNRKKHWAIDVEVYYEALVHIWLVPSNFKCSSSQRLFVLKVATNTNLIKLMNPK